MAGERARLKLRPASWSLLLFLGARASALAQQKIETDQTGTTGVNSTFTSGNLNTQMDLSMSLRDELTKVQLMYIPTKEENDTFKFFKDLEQNVVADFYDQDPKSFVPEQKGYFRIVENRGIVYTVLAKVMFYLFIIFGLMKLLFGYFTTVPKNYILQTLGNERKVHGKRFSGRLRVINILTGITFLWMSLTCIMTLNISSANKTLLAGTGINLKSLNTDIVNQVTEAQIQLNNINLMKAALRNGLQSTDQFVIKNNIQVILDEVKLYANATNLLTKNVLTSTILAKVWHPLSSLIMVIVIFTGSLLALYKRSSNLANCLYFICAVMGSFSFLMANYQISSVFMFTDLCEQMRFIMIPGQNIINPGGIKQYMSCLNENFQETIIDQLGNVVAGEYILLEQINFELDRIRIDRGTQSSDTNVTSITDALSRPFQVSEPSQLVFFRDQYLKLANLTNIVKRKLLKLPNCFYLNDWAKDFNKNICNTGLNSSYKVFNLTITLGFLFYIYAALLFYIDRLVSQLLELDRVENIQLYHRVASNQHPLYRLNDFMELT